MTTHKFIKNVRKMTEDKRFIEVSFPIKEVGEESAREKNIRHGHISTLHIWWARRPLASSRATNYAALIKLPKEKKRIDEKKKFIIELSKWENTFDLNILKNARKDILESNEDIIPKVLDPFGGGGSIPLEALRLGCETYSNDYNPVAVFIQKCTLEYPQKYGRLNQKEWEGLKATSNSCHLLEDIKKWGTFIINETNKELSRFYPKDFDGSIPVGYIWVRTLPCQNPSCSIGIPLMRQFWLANKKDKKIALFPYVDNNQIKFKIVGDNNEKIPDLFNPSKGTVSKAFVTCPVCGNVIEDKNTRELFRHGLANEKIVAVVIQNPNEKGKNYRIATEKDMEAYYDAKEFLKEKRMKLMVEWGYDPVPDEVIHTPDNKEYIPNGLLYNFTPVLLYGMTRWGHLFNSRQLLSNIVFIEKIRECKNKLNTIYPDKEYTKVILSYISLILSRIPDTNSKLCHWDGSWEKTATTFSRQALPMNWDYIESNVFSIKGYSYENIMRNVLLVLEKNMKINKANIKITSASATSLPYPDNFFDAVFTDPPYYDNVPYSDLSDFFYVWLKRVIGDLYPELFSTPLTPKTNEAISELPLLRGMKKEIAAKLLDNIKTKEHFELLLSKSFHEINRVLKHNGIATIVYAHKTNEGWESLINSLLDSGLIVTAAWPINTEMKSRLRAKESAALASSIYIVARKLERNNTGFYNNIKEELKAYLNIKLDVLWNEGIVGADFFISAIGAGIEIFGKYEKVMDYEGNIIRADKLLEDVRKIATDYAIKQILQNGFASEISKLTLFYVLWRWEFGEVKAPFDEARKLGQSVGIDISTEWGKYSFIKKDKEFIEVLNPKERKLEDLEGSDELIDVLHYCLLMWEKGNKDKILEVLAITGFGKADIFYRVAQAISETLPNENKEKKLLDGFLSGKEKLKKDISNRVVNKQQRLDELI